MKTEKQDAEKREKMCEKKSWEFKVGGVAVDVRARFYSIETSPGPIRPDYYTPICKFLVQNVGSENGIIYLKLAELNETGAILRESGSTKEYVKPGECMTAEGHIDEKSLGFGPPARRICATGKKGDIYAELPTGTYYIGVKTWGDGEDEPSSYSIPLTYSTTMKEGIAFPIPSCKFKIFVSE